MSCWKKVGIVGGLGPRASSHFYKMLVDTCSKKYNAVQDSDYPYLVIVNLASNGLNNIGEINELTLLSDIRLALELFEDLGISIAAIPCNSVYVLYNQLISNRKIRLINIYDEVATTIARLEASNAIILASRGLVHSRGYDPYLDKLDITPFYPSETIQMFIDKWIKDVMSGSYTSRTIENFLEVVQNLGNQKEIVIIGCSELSVLFESSHRPPNIIDSMQILAEATLSNAFLI